MLEDIENIEPIIKATVQDIENACKNIEQVFREAGLEDVES